MVIQRLVEKLAEILDDKRTTTPSMKCVVMKFTMELLFREMKLKRSQQSSENENQKAKISLSLRKKEPISHLLVLISPIIRICHLLKDSFEEDSSVVQAAAGLCVWVHDNYREGEIEKMLEESTTSSAKNEDGTILKEGLEEQLSFNILTFVLFLSVLISNFYISFAIILFPPFIFVLCR
jgi:hypothetical protein